MIDGDLANEVSRRSVVCDHDGSPKDVHLPIARACEFWFHLEASAAWAAASRAIGTRYGEAET